MGSNKDCKALDEAMDTDGTDTWMTKSAKIDGTRVQDAPLTIRVCGHCFKNISGNELECVRCDETKMVPTSLTQSTGFVQAVWKLYLLGRFKNKHSCKSGHKMLDRKYKGSLNLRHQVSATNFVQYN